jgi:choline dehydrogenase-like flavoprotein
VLIRNALDPEMLALIECGDEEAYRRPRAEPSHRLETIALSARARMGSDDAAVVDERLAVHDASGLKVFDVSVVRSIISGNTNIAMTIAEKAAYMISSRHGLGGAAR